MLKDLLNREVVITYEAGYSYFNKKGIITRVSTDFVTLNNNTMIFRKKIIKIVIKEKK